MDPLQTTPEQTRERLEFVGRMIVDAAFQIHKQLGPGLLESVYELLLARALTDRGLHAERQKRIACVINGVEFDEVFRADLIVEDCVVVEIKAVEKLAFVHEAQVLTYLKLLDYRLGFLINFGTPLIKQGIRRFVNNF